MPVCNLTQVNPVDAGDLSDDAADGGDGLGILH